MALQINISRFIQQGIHPDRLKALNIQWLEALLFPLRPLLNTFYLQRDADLYKLTHNGQVCYLRGMLNDTFDNEQRRITVGPAPVYDYTYFYPEDDDKCILFEEEGDNEELFAQDYYIGTTAVNFNVYVPLVIGITEDEEIRMRALLNYYKPDSKRYAIVKT